MRYSFFLSLKLFFAVFLCLIAIICFSSWARAGFETNAQEEFQKTESCVCQNNSMCSDICTFEYVAGRPYVTPLHCGSVITSTPDQAVLNSYCNRTKRTKGDIDGDGMIAIVDYFYLLRVRSGWKVPDRVYGDVNGDGVVTTTDESILISVLSQSGAPSVSPTVTLTPTLTPTVPITLTPAPTRTLACPTTSTNTYDQLSISGNPTDRNPAEHPDLNIKLRGYEYVDFPKQLVDIPGDRDAKAPNLKTLIHALDYPEIGGVMQVYDWDWARGEAKLPSSKAVTMIRLAQPEDGYVKLPQSGYDIGGGHQALVLFVDESTITLTYTRNDSIVSGYALQILDICVDPNLKQLYRTLNQEGRRSLPALKGGDKIGSAKVWDESPFINVAVRDSGIYRDPRSRKDWWP